MNVCIHEKCDPVWRWRKEDHTAFSSSTYPLPLGVHLIHKKNHDSRQKPEEIYPDE